MRKLSPDERRLWDFVTRSVTPLSPRHAAGIEDASPPRIAPVSFDPAPIAHRSAHHQPLRVGHLVDLDAATAKTFRKGKMPRDAALDLHGLTLAQAHAALIHFIHAQAARGSRCVLVITGKGSPDGQGKEGRGRIKAELMHWLNAGSLRPFILGVTEANPKQPVGGAVYVLLKRRERARTR
jgi:DNA-nicking Smr family endonuclease